jgi:hypothetical protein
MLFVASTIIVYVPQPQKSQKTEWVH